MLRNALTHVLLFSSNSLTSLHNLELSAAVASCNRSISDSNSCILQFGDELLLESRGSRSGTGHLGARVELQCALGDTWATIERVSRRCTQVSVGDLLSAFASPIAHEQYTGRECEFKGGFMYSRVQKPANYKSVECRDAIKRNETRGDDLLGM